MIAEPKIFAPSPILDAKEKESLEVIQKRYDKLCSPGALGKAGKAVAKVVPTPVKDLAKNIGSTITEQKLFEQMMGTLNDGFKLLEETASKYTIPRTDIIRRVNKATNDYEIKSVDEICLARGYDISKLVNDFRTKDLLLALGEGAGTGVFGFWGLPFNLVISIFIYYRAVQAVATFYGYDVKEDPSELIIASDVFVNAMSPSTPNANEITSTIAKFMAFAEAETVKQAAKKTYAEMISRGGASLLIVQLRALANKAAKKALDKAGEKGLENIAFKAVFEQIGKKLSKKAVGRVVPVVSAAIGGLFDVSQMNTVISYADVFYNKRFLIEKEDRINRLINPNGVIDVVEFVEVETSEPEEENTFTEA